MDSQQNLLLGIVFTFEQEKNESAASRVKGIIVSAWGDDEAGSLLQVSPEQKEMYMIFASEHFFVPQKTEAEKESALEQTGNEFLKKALHYRMSQKQLLLKEAQKENDQQEAARLFEEIRTLASKLK
jgi:hypothetical protein